MQRIESLDILRGIAIIGILFMNIYHHGIFEIGYSPFEAPLLSDTLINVFNAFFIDGRFRTLFCLLFGIGLAIQYEGYKQKDADPASFLRARLNWLLIFGLIHSIFIFSGDILTTYALAGFVVYRQLNLSQDALLQKIKKYMTIGVVTMLLISIWPVDPVYRHGEEFNEIVTQWNQGYIEQLVHQVIFTAAMFLINLVCLIWLTAGIVLFGVFLYRSQFFTKGLSFKYALICVAATLFISSIDGYIRFFYTGFAELSAFLATLSALFCALIYMHLIVKAGTFTKKILSVFKYAGRMALSLYLMQSVVFAIYFRAFYPEFIFDATRFDYLQLVLIYTVVQLIFAYCYFKVFKQGPFEWLWRKAYLQTPERNKINNEHLTS